MLELSKVIKDDAKIIIYIKKLNLDDINKIFKNIFKFFPSKNNFLPSSYLNNLYSSCNSRNKVRNERLIALPINIPIITSFINRL